MPANGAPVGPVTAGVQVQAPLTKLVVSVYVPILIAGLVLAMMLTMLPLYLVDSGIDLATSGAVLAAAGVGSALAGLPIGAALTRWGDRLVLVVSFGLLGFAIAAIGFLQTVAVLTAVRIVAGIARSAVRLSRQSYVTRRVPGDRRGRAMALIGGAMRIGFVVGPFLGGWLIEALGYRSAFVVVGVLAGLGIGPAWISDLVGPELTPQSVEAEAGPNRGLVDGVRHYWKRLLWAGGGPVLVMTARSGRYVVLTFIAEDLGLSPSQVGATLTVSTVADLAVFPVAGWVMDRFGRLQAMVPAFSLMALGLVGLGLAGSVTAVVVAGAVIGVGNGLSSGSMLTLASDLAPADATGPFLAGMSTMQDLGNVAGPLLVGLVGERLGLGPAALVLAAGMALGVVWLIWVVGESGTAQAENCLCE